MREVTKVSRVCHGYKVRFESNKWCFCRNGGSTRLSLAVRMNVTICAVVRRILYVVSPFWLLSLLCCFFAKKNTLLQIRQLRLKEAKKYVWGHRASRVEQDANPGLAKSIPVSFHAPAASMSLCQRGWKEMTYNIVTIATFQFHD